MSKRRKRYDGNLHDQPYDLEGGVFDKRKPDTDYDDRDLARLAVDQPDRDEPDPLTQLDLSKHGGSQEMLDGSAEFGTDAGDSEDRLSELGGKPRPAPVTRQLVQDAGGYATQTDPAMLWKTATAWYCLQCGEPIGSPERRIPCDVPNDPCVLEVQRGRLMNGCQGCREQWALDRKHSRTRGNPPQTCRPKPGQERRYTCAYLWQKYKEKCRRRGEEPTPHAPNLTKRDRDRMENAVFREEQRRKSIEGVWDHQHPDGYQDPPRPRITNQFDPAVIPPERLPRGPL